LVLIFKETNVIYFGLITKCTFSLNYLISSRSLMFKFFWAFPLLRRGAFFAFIFLIGISQLKRISAATANAIPLS